MSNMDKHPMDDNLQFQANKIARAGLCVAIIAIPCGIFSQEIKSGLISVANNMTSAAYAMSGDLKYDKGENREALEDYNRAISLNPNDAGVYNNRGNLKRRLNSPKDALADYNKAIALDSKYP